MRRDGSDARQRFNCTSPGWVQSGSSVPTRGVDKNWRFHRGSGGTPQVALLPRIRTVTPYLVITFLGSFEPRHGST